MGSHSSHRGPITTISDEEKEVYRFLLGRGISDPGLKLFVLSPFCTSRVRKDTSFEPSTYVARMSKVTDPESVS